MKINDFKLEVFLKNGSLKQNISYHHRTCKLSQLKNFLNMKLVL